MTEYPYSRNSLIARIFEDCRGFMLQLEVADRMRERNGSKENNYDYKENNSFSKVNQLQIRESWDN